jgi:beta-galactosidase
MERGALTDLSQDGSVKLPSLKQEPNGTFSACPQMSMFRRTVYPCSLWGEVVHLAGARALGVFTHDYYANGPALTAHQYGQGKAYYLATRGSDQLLAALMRQLCQEAAIPSLLGVQERLEITQRKRADGRNVYFLLNHGEKAEEVILPEGKFTSLLNGVQLEGRIEVAARDIAVLLEGKSIH